MIVKTHTAFLSESNPMLCHGRYIGEGARVELLRHEVVFSAETHPGWGGNKQVLSLVTHGRSRGWVRSDEIAEKEDDQ